MVIYICLLTIGLLRIVLAILPYQFHTLNHKQFSIGFVLIILSMPVADTAIRLLTCGHACDTNINVIIFGLYGTRLNLKNCKSVPYFLAFVVPLLILVYSGILFLEYFRHDRVAPLSAVLGPAVSEDADVSFRTGLPSPGLYPVRDLSQRNIRDSEGLHIQTISQNVCSLAWQAREPDLSATSSDPASKKSKDLTRLVIRTGGVTFLAFLAFGMAAYAVYSFNYVFFVTMLVKTGCLFTNLPWYWISMDDNIRTATDNMMKNVPVIKKLFFLSM
jgi:hypothetical protein